MFPQPAIVTAVLNGSCALENLTVASSGLRRVAYSPDGSCLAAIDCSTPTNILTFGVNPDCSLSGPLSTVQLANALDLKFSPTNNNCLVVLGTNNEGFSQVNSFAITDCMLPTSPTSTATTQFLGVLPLQLSFSPDGSCIAVANRTISIGSGTGANFDIYAIDSSCILANVQNCSPNPSERGRSIGWAPNGCLYFVTNGHIYVYSQIAPCATTLEVTKCCKVFANDKVRFEVSVKNTGLNPATGVVATDLPPSLTLYAPRVQTGLYQRP